MRTNFDMQVKCLMKDNYSDMEMFLECKELLKTVLNFFGDRIHSQSNQKYALAKIRNTYYTFITEIK